MSNFKTLMKSLLTAWGNKFANEHGVLVKSWMASDGLSWYRKYSDGWIEQGGYVSSTANNSAWELVLPTPFSNTNYVALRTSGNPDVTDGYYGAQANANYYQIWGKTTTSFRTLQSTTYKSLGKFTWYACGF